MHTTILILTLITGGGNVFIKEIDFDTVKGCETAGLAWKKELDKKLNTKVTITSFVCVDKNYK